MEIIPADDESSDVNAEPAKTAPLDSRPAVHEPLGVELLEDKVLLASDTTGGTPVPAESVPTEPAPLVASPIAGAEAAHKLALAAEAAEAGTEADTLSPLSAASGENHVEPMEVPRELLEWPSPEDGHAVERLADGGGESDSGRNEFGLATIKPEKGKSIHSHDAATMFEPVDAPYSEIDDSSETDSDGSRARRGEPGIDVRVLNELGQERPEPELAASLAEETALAPLLDDMPAAATPTARASLAECQETLVATSPAPDSNVASHSAEHVSQAHLADSAGQSEDGKTSRSESLSMPTRPSADAETTPFSDEPAAHDAIFAAGGGVEAVIDQGTPRLTTS